MKLLAGRSHPLLAERISAHLGPPISGVAISDFPDGGTRVQILDNLRGRDVFLLQSLQRPSHSRLMELLLLADAARRADAARITAVLPFFGYDRQDRSDSHPPAALGAKLVADLLATAGIGRILTVDLHSPAVAGFFSQPLELLSADPLFLPPLQQQVPDHRSVVSPDLGGAKRAAAWAAALHCPLVLLAKRRTDEQEAEITDVLGEVEGRHLLLVDDRVETAATLSAAAGALHARGAASVRAVVSHTALTPEAPSRLRRSGIEALITSNSVPIDADPGLPVTVLDLAPLLGNAIRCLHENRSPAGALPPGEFRCD